MRRDRIRLSTGGWLSGTITDFDDSAYYLSNVVACPAVREMIDPLGDNAARIPHELVVDVVIDDEACKCCVDDAALPERPPMVLTSFPMFDLRHDLCEACYYRLVDAARDPEMYAHFTAKHSADSLSFPPEWIDLDERAGYAYELWLISVLRSEGVTL